MKHPISNLYVIVFKNTPWLSYDSIYVTKSLAEDDINQMENPERLIAVSLDDHIFRVTQNSFLEGRESAIDEYSDYNYKKYNEPPYSAGIEI